MRVNNTNEYFEIGDKNAVAKVTDAFLKANKNNEVPGTEIGGKKAV